MREKEDKAGDVIVFTSPSPPRFQRCLIKTDIGMAIGLNASRIGCISK